MSGLVFPIGLATVAWASPTGEGRRLRSLFLAIAIITLLVGLVITLQAVLVWDAVSGVFTAGWILVIGGLLLDLGTCAASGYFTRSRRLGTDPAGNNDRNEK